ncbi:uncharacterized protein LOC118436060 [Folsomia candida]|uniref:uncharacterized protein LOC118436060 n=1 Tax=Folsomia candida TaxID=158441 RepID=UPI00160549FB|nr:uncharacterized protein LOC118436060 [Folsomia candida]
MTDYSQFGAVLAQLANNPAPPIPALDNIIEWDDVSGNPIFPDPQEVWRRFVPNSMRIKSFANTVVAREFIAGMENGQRQTFTVNYNGNGGTDTATERSLLGWILGGDLKMIHVQRTIRRLTVTKTLGLLIPFDNHYPLQPLRVSKEGTRIGKPINDLMLEINLNAERGVMGPGSFCCREPHCVVTGPLITQCSVVQWGSSQNQRVNLRKRFTCSTTNVVYLEHCQACYDDGGWSTYVGETAAKRNAHGRFGQHDYELCNERNGKRYPNNAAVAAEINQIMQQPPAPERDPEQLMRDPYSHFNYVHQRTDRRYTFVDGGFRSSTERKATEYLFMVQCGNFTYNSATFSGSLNQLTLD